MPYNVKLAKMAKSKGLNLTFLRLKDSENSIAMVSLENEGLKVFLCGLEDRVLNAADLWSCGCELRNESGFEQNHSQCQPSFILNHIYHICKKLKKPFFNSIKVQIYYCTCVNFRVVSTLKRRSKHKVRGLFRQSKRPKEVEITTPL